jgi:hypothetical protein
LAPATGIRQLITFHADGTVLRSVPGEASIDPARPPHTAAHGVWRYLGNGRFGVTIWDLFYDVNTAQPLRYNRLRLEVTLGDDRDNASARAIVDIVDLQGVVVGSRTGSANFAHSVGAARVGRDADGQCCHERDERYRRPGRFRPR